MNSSSTKKSRRAKLDELFILWQKWDLGKLRTSLGQTFSFHFVQLSGAFLCKLMPRCVNLSLIYCHSQKPLHACPFYIDALLSKMPRLCQLERKIFKHSTYCPFSSLGCRKLFIWNGALLSVFLLGVGNTSRRVTIFTSWGGGSRTQMLQVDWALYITLLGYEMVKTMKIKWQVQTV